MSKLIKNMLTDDLKTRLADVGEAIVVSLGTLDAQRTTELRQALRKKKIHLKMVKNSLARRATAGTPLAPAFEDVVDLAKELDRLSGVKEFQGFECRGGALDGARLDANDVKQVAKWPTRAEQLSILSGQIISLASTLAGQIVSAGGTLAGQIASRVEDLEKEGGDAAPAA